jgi:enoyl-CoA hydratase/carnithine racemase
VGYQTLNFEVSAGVATITLNRPNSMNAMSPQMGAELHEVALKSMPIMVSEPWF